MHNLLDRDDSKVSWKVEHNSKQTGIQFKAGNQTCINQSSVSLETEHHNRTVRNNEDYWHELRKMDQNQEKERGT